MGQEYSFSPQQIVALYTGQTLIDRNAPGGNESIKKVEQLEALLGQDLPPNENGRCYPAFGDKDYNETYMAIVRERMNKVMPSLLDIDIEFARHERSTRDRYTGKISGEEMYGRLTTGFRSIVDEFYNSKNNDQLPDSMNFKKQVENFNRALPTIIKPAYVLPSPDFDGKRNTTLDQRGPGSSTTPPVLQK